MTTPVQDQSKNKYWKSFEQLEETPEYQAALERLSPDGAAPSEMSRRSFIGIMGAAFAMSGLAGCSRPVSKILPYNKLPEELVPGVPQHYATAWDWRGSAEGLLATAYEGRPTKIEGNPDHPVNLGKSDVFTQAHVLSLYDPDRSQTVLHNGQPSSWNAFMTWADQALSSSSGGRGVAVLEGYTSSPMMEAMRGEVRRRFPQSRWYQYEPVNRDQEIQGSEIAFGSRRRAQVDFSQADIVVSLDSDFLGAGVNSVAQARGYARARRVESEKDDMNRLYMVEPMFSVTGSNADHRLPAKHGDIPHVAAALAAHLSDLGVSIRVDARSLIQSLSASELSHDAQKFIDAAAGDLFAHRGRCVVVAGRTQPAAVHALCHELNRALGAVGSVVRYTQEPLPADCDGSLRDLAGDLDSGAVNTLIIIGANPAYAAPGDLDLKSKLGKAGHLVHFGMYADETAQSAEWHLPESHSLESWGDARTYDGTVTVQQPLISPLYDTRSALELMAFLAGRTIDNTAGHTLVRQAARSTWRGATWRGAGGGSDFEALWGKAVHDGFLADFAFRELIPGNPSGGRIEQAWRSLPRVQSGVEVVFKEHPSLYDGRFANLAWLQELPDPISKLTWDNVIYVSPAMASEMNLATEDLVTLDVGGRQVTAPVWVQPGHAEGSVTVHLGYGRTRAGRVGDAVGFDVYSLRSAESPHAAVGSLTKTGAKYKLATTQHHWDMEDRPLAREATLEHYRHHPDFTEHMEEVLEGHLYQDIEYDYSEGYQWGMAIDLNTCTGCNACVVACQSENNIPSVGKDQVMRGRELHWIRMDRYFSGDEANPLTIQQPIPCQQCENAPCEAVCPVNATTHSDEGLNDMVYNRCIGTRYCANNCPYKVRRFNFYDYNKEMTEIEKMQKNPNVTVRMRGVMEKCTFCVQRINRTKIGAKNQGRMVRDGEIQTACQQSCPADAIAFGDINDPGSRVSKIKAQNRDYQMLGWVNTKPRTTYQSRIRNPNPKLEQHS